MCNCHSVPTWYAYDELGRFCRLFLTAAPLMLPQLKGGEAHTCVSVPLAHTLFGSLCANLHV